MTKQSSFIKFEGKMDGVSFYKTRDGAHLARKATGPAKRRILTDPRFVRTRENMSEFSGLATAANSFMTVFSGVRNFKDGQFRNRLIKVLRTMARRNEAIRGQRGVRILDNGELLVNMELNSVETFSSIFSGRFTASNNAERTTGSMSLAGFNPTTLVAPPPAATHYRLVQLLGVVSDTVYNAETKRFEPANMAVNGLSEITFSPYLPVAGDEQTVTLETTFAGITQMPAEAGVVQAVGIIFFEQLRGIYYTQSEGIAMKIVRVF